jgi:hypothetical protein
LRVHTTAPHGAIRASGALLRCVVRPVGVACEGVVVGQRQPAQHTAFQYGGPRFGERRGASVGSPCAQR